MTTTETKEITNSDEVIDVRDVIARVEELETRGATVADDESEEDEVMELATLRGLLEDLAGNGGDEEWRGDWYPVTLIRCTYFEDFAREEAEQLGLIDSNAKWPHTCIDWGRAAEELQDDYSSCDFDGIDYLYR